MTKNNIRVCIKRKKSNEEKETNYRKRISGLLQFIGYQCPITDHVTLRAEAERKLNEINERKRIREGSSSSHTVTCEIQKRKPITSTRVNYLHSNPTTGPSTLNRQVKHHGTTIQQSEVPPEVTSYIKNIKGDSDTVELVFEKKLTASDVNNSQGHLLMPLKQVQRKDILIQIEKLRETVRVYVPPKQEHYDLCLTQWDMSGNQNYVLKSGWNVVVKENELQKSTVVQLWSFQVGDTPCLLLFPVDGGMVEGGGAGEVIGDGNT